MGEFAALITAFLWAGTSIFFTFAGKQIGSQVLNRVRLTLAVLLLSLTHWFVIGNPFPIDASPERWLWLGLSGLIGLVIGDALLFRSFILIGHRIAMLIMSLVPAISTIFAWLLLGETLLFTQILGIGLTIFGVALVVTDCKNKTPTQINLKDHWLGLLLAFGGAVGQAVGLIYAKKGLVDNYSALSGVLIRMISAMLIVWILALFTKQVKKTFIQLKNHPDAIKFITAGAISGPFLGVWLSLIAVQSSKVGIASTLMALTPIFHLPIGKYLLKEKITIQAILGTVVAMVGIAIIFIC